jgi:protein-tyrosine phosphatase
VHLWKGHSVTNSFERHITIPGTYNLRDIGGYATVDGRTTRWRTLLRADSLHALTEAGRRALLNLGVQTIIDLRRPAEVHRYPNVFAGLNEARYHNIPLFDDRSAAAIDHQALTLEELYRNYFDYCQAQVRNVLDVLAHAESGPVLIHCMVGKDRTGVSVALALAAAGVAEQTIIDDYAPSADNLKPLFDQWRAELMARGEPTTRFDRVTGSPPAAMEAALVHLHAQYGGPIGYLRKIGLSTADIAAIRDKLTE